VNALDETDPWGTFVRELGHNIAVRRAEQGLSQEETAYRAGLSRYTYQKLERGSGRPNQLGNPSLRSVVLVALALDTTLEELVPDAPDILRR